MAALDMGITLGRPPTGPELLEYMEVEPDGLTAGHRSYLCALRQHFDKWVGQGDDRHIEYVSGAKSMQTILREGDVGLERIERYLMERGLVKHSPRGRCLTTRGVARAEQLINAGKGLIIE